jgi:hypothetical protein
LAVENGQDLLHGVQVRGRTLARVAPLLEYAQLHGARDGRHLHAGHHTGAPLLAALALVIDDVHWLLPPRDCR